MKKALFLALSLVLILTGCSNGVESKYKQIEQSKNFSLFAHEDTNGVLSDYLYFIYNNKGDKIASAYYGNREPKLSIFDNGILKVFVSGGTNAGVSTYYNLETSLASDTYENVYYDDGEIVIYIDYSDGNIYVCAKKIFGSDFLLKEKLDMGGISTTLFDVSYSNGLVKVEHAKGEKYDTIVETFELNVSNNE